jgi:hypothetical protein
MDGELDFSRYTDRELQEARTTLDRLKFPINSVRLDEELRKRSSSAPIKPRPSPDVHRITARLPHIEDAAVRFEVVDLDAIPSGDQLKVFWGFLWRSYAAWLASFIAALIVGVLAGVLLGIFGPAVGLKGTTLHKASQIVGFVLAILAGWYFHGTLSAGFSRFRSADTACCSVAQSVKVMSPNNALERSVRD